MHRAWLFLLIALFVAANGIAAAQISDDVVKIGVLTDMSGPSSAADRPGSVTAAQMAIDDFGGTVLGKPIQPHLRRPSDQTRHRRQPSPAMVRSRSG